jgi:hypothetical protein
VMLSRVLLDALREHWRRHKPSVRPTPAFVGLRGARKNSFPSPMPTSFSPCPVLWQSSHCRISSSSTRCCCASAPKR